MGLRRLGGKRRDSTVQRRKCMSVNFPALGIREEKKSGISTVVKRTEAARRMQSSRSRDAGIDGGGKRDRKAWFGAEGMRLNWGKRELNKGGRIESPFYMGGTTPNQ